MKIAPRRRAPKSVPVSPTLCGKNPTTGPKPHAWCFTCRALVPFNRSGGVTIPCIAYSRGACPTCGDEIYRVAGGKEDTA